MAHATRKELVAVIAERTMHLQGKHELAGSVAAYIQQESRAIDLNSLLRDVMQYRQDYGIIEATAVSAHQLDTRVLDDIKQLLQDHFPDATSILVDQKIDETVVGGVRIELPRETLDLSIRNKLNTFKRLVAEEGAR